MADYSYMAYLDILGYKQLLDADIAHGNQSFKDKMISAFQAFDNVNSAKYSRKVISDSIFISCSDRDSIYELLELLSAVFCSFLDRGLLLRGGLSYGEHFHNETITYSPVLTKAYLLESQRAIFPRIMVDRNICDMFPDLAASNAVLQSGPNFFINVSYNKDLSVIYAAAKQLFENDKDEIVKSESVRIKHKWLQDFLLDVNRLNSTSIPEPYLYTFDQVESEPKEDTADESALSESILSENFDA